MSAGGKPGVWVTLTMPWLWLFSPGSGAALERAHQVEDALGRLDEGALPDQRDQEIELAIGAMDRPLLLEQTVQKLGRALAGHRHVDVRVGAIADQGRGEARHVGREVGVIVEARHD